MTTYLIVFGINEITLILTFLTVFATFLAVKEMKQQRQNSYLPDLHIASVFRSVYAYNVEEGEEGFRYQKKGYRYGEVTEDSAITSYNPENPITSSGFHVTICNLGFGAAKSVQYEWEYDFAALKRIIEDIPGNKEYKCRFFQDSENDNISESFQIKAPNGQYVTYQMHFKKLIYEIDFVSSGENHSNIVSTYLPGCYIDLITYYFCIKHEVFERESEKRVFTDNLKNIPPLFMKLQYADIGGKLHKKRIQLTISATGLFGPKLERSNYMKGAIARYRVQSKEV